MLMDEPFGALDALTRERMNAELLRIWAQSDKTIIFVIDPLDPEAVFLGSRRRHDRRPRQDGSEHRDHPGLPTDHRDEDSQDFGGSPGRSTISSASTRGGRKIMMDGHEPVDDSNATRLEARDG
ncbi:MAG: hypothetical protein R3D25_17425 [Geminicoccaceae bacterium]